MTVQGFRKLLIYMTIFLPATLAGVVPLHGEESMEQVRPKVGFALQKVGSRYEPIAPYHEPFRLPGTDMRFAAYTHFAPGDDVIGVPKWGFLLDNGRFFYIDEPAASLGDSHYALSGDYFVVSGSAYGASHNESMYLFRYDRNSMKLLDMIQETHFAIPFFDFWSDYPGKPAYGHEVGAGHHDVPVWIIGEKDRQGHPLLRLKMARDVPLAFSDAQEFDVFHIYLKIAGGRLRVALDPDLYEPVFGGLGEAGGPRSRSTEYYVSGFLAGKLSLARIRAELAGNKRRRWIINILGQVKKWDTALHTRYGEPMPRIVEYKLNGR